MAGFGKWRAVTIWKTKGTLFRGFSIFIFSCLRYRRSNPDAAGRCGAPDPLSVGQASMASVAAEPVDGFVFWKRKIKSPAAPTVQRMLGRGGQVLKMCHVRRLKRLVFETIRSAEARGTGRRLAVYGGFFWSGRTLVETILRIYNLSE